MTTAVRSERDTDFYSAGGWGYTDRDGDANTVARWMHEFGVGAGKLLDVGCGDGWWTSLFADYGIDTVGIDRSADAIRVAQREHPGPEYRCVALAEFITGSARALGPFGTVFVRGLSSTGVPWSPTASVEMDLLCSLLAPGGTLLVVRSTDRTGNDSDSVIVNGGRATNPTLAALVQMVERVADVFKVTVEDKTVAIGARR